MNNKKLIPYGRQDISKSDLKAVQDVLKSDFLTTGPQVPKFERLFSNYVKADYATAVNSATSGLHIACMALGLNKGDLLWTSAISFVASANCGLYCGAEVDFIDIDIKTFNISAETLQRKIESSSRLPKIIVLVHMCGLASELEEIKKICDKNNIKIIEDASHAVGSKYKTNMIGNCKYSDITVFSFHPVKIITTGEGGMVTTNLASLDKKIKLLRTHGIKRSNNQNPNQPWAYSQEHLGFNYRMNDIEAALGINQLKRVRGFLIKRNKIAKNYKSAFDGLPLEFQYVSKDSYSSYHLFVIKIAVGSNTLNRKIRLELFNHLVRNNINVNLHYIPIYKHQYYKKMNKYLPLKNAEKYYSQAISLPIFASLSANNQSKVIRIIRDYFRKAK